MVILDMLDVMALVAGLEDVQGLDVALVADDQLMPVEGGCMAELFCAPGAVGCRGLENWVV